MLPSQGLEHALIEEIIVFQHIIEKAFEENVCNPQPLLFANDVLVIQIRGIPVRRTFLRIKDYVNWVCVQNEFNVSTTNYCSVISSENFWSHGGVPTT